MDILSFPTRTHGRVLVEGTGAGLFVVFHGSGTKVFYTTCKHFKGIDQPDGTEESERPVRPAFPGGIPLSIAYEDNLHLTPEPGQVGDTVFEKQHD